MRCILCYPLFDERKSSHRFSFLLKQALAQKGLALERFDYTGTGEADGEFADVTLDSLRRDLEGFFSADQLTLIGLRFGGTLSLEFTLRHPEQVQRLILIEPVVLGKSYVEDLRRKQRIKDLLTGNHPTDAPASNMEFCNMEGYKTNVRLIRQLEQLDVGQRIPEQLKLRSIHIVQISDHPAIHACLQRLAEVLTRCAETLCLEQVTFPRFWERISVTDYSVLLDKITGMV